MASIIYSCYLEIYVESTFCGGKNTVLRIIIMPPIKATKPKINQKEKKIIVIFYISETYFQPMFSQIPFPKIFQMVKNH